MKVKISAEDAKLLKPALSGKRHAKPTALSLAERAYRKTLALEKAMAFQLTELQTIKHRVGEQHAIADMVGFLQRRNELDNTLKTMATHCERLLREKETLQKQLAMVCETASYKQQKNDDWLEPVKGFCAFAHLHRDGVICAVCNHNAPRRFEYRSGQENESIIVHSHPYGLPCTDECKTLKATPE